MRMLATTTEVHVWRAKLDDERRALPEVLARYLGVAPAEIELRAGERGKPELADPEAALRFNLSHSAGLALVAVTDGVEVGVDVEKIKPRRELVSLARRALPAAEAAAVVAEPPAARLAAFHAAWVRHEATVKCFGVGLHAPLPDAPVTVCAIEAEPGFAAALAVAAEAVPTLRYFTLGPDGAAA
jgi:4'-phosphopantetheinyl transferase